MTAGAFFAVVFCYASSLTEGTVACNPGDRLPADTDPQQIDRLLQAEAIRFQADEEASEEAPVVQVEPEVNSAPKKRAPRKPKTVST